MDKRTSPFFFYLEYSSEQYGTEEKSSEGGFPLKRTNVGGQAVIEGVMMRGKKTYAMAVRNPEGGITLEKDSCNGLGGKLGLFKLPIFRGMAAFVDSLVMGTKILMRSAELAGEGIVEEEGEPSKFETFLENKLGSKLNEYLIDRKSVV